ncbi:restriction endonuclease [Lacinutrix cladophorae]
MNWYEYQEFVADVFRNIGAEVETNYKAVGARGEHDLDVWIKLDKLGIEMTWICECKYWKDSIPKEKVLTLYEITKDLGVDRGFLFSESGFQSGAIRCTKNTNITLTSVDEIKDLIKQELEEAKLINFLKRIETIKNIVKKSWIDDLGNPIANNNSNFDKCLTIDGTLMFTSLQIQKAINNNYPISLTRYSMENSHCKNIDELNKTLSEELDNIENVVEEIRKQTEKKDEEVSNKIDIFIHAIKSLLISSEYQLFNKSVDIDKQVFETLKHMKTVGKSADELKEISNGTLAINIHKMMRLLIENIYPHLTKIEMDINEWKESEEKILHQLEILTNK